ncbi:uncharacterized protein LOC144745228 [Ciona intestinalis]
MLRYYESKSITQKYQKYRPHYPIQLAEDALGNLKEKKLDFLLDVGCGGGQSVNIFAPYFHEVLAIDPSENQIKEAKSQNKFAHVTYKRGFAEKLPCDDVSVDVITAGTAIHWFDRPKFYKEVERVLKPGGRLIVFGYWAPKLVPIGITGDVNKLSHIGSQLLEDAYFIGTRGKDDLKQAYNVSFGRYAKIFNELDFTFTNKRRFDHLLSEYVWSLGDVKGLIHSLDAYEPYMKSKQMELKELSEEERNARLLELDYSEQFVRSLKESWECTEMENSDVKMKVIFNFFVIVADKPTL